MPLKHNAYAIYRFENNLAVFTVSRSELSRQEMAELSRGEWPCWDKVAKAVPELIHSTIGFDACTSFE
ncbi:MAG: hypothetical protein WBV28_10775 [Terracidiphilus sp.]